MRNNIVKNTGEAITQLGLDNSSTVKCPIGTVMLAMTGQGLTRGRVSILGLEACANQSVCHMIVNNDLIFNKYLFYYLQTYYWKIRLLDKGSSQPGLNVNIIRNFEIPICSIKEQKQIVDKIEQGLPFIENTKNITNSMLLQLDTLRASVLKQAFEGKLVPQDPNDEPASVLLERINKEKTQ